MWIEKADLRLVTDVEIRTGTSGSEYATFRAKFPGKKDAPRDEPVVWYGGRAFGDALEQLRDAKKGSTVEFKGRLETSNWQPRDGGDLRTEVALVVSEVFKVRAGEAPANSSAASMADVGRRNPPQTPPSAVSARQRMMDAGIPEEPSFADLQAQEDLPF